MEFLGAGIGIMAALLWGSADTIATLAARRLGTFKTTFVSQSAGFLALFSFGVIAYVFMHLPFTLTTAAFSTLIGIFSGVFAALGYFYFYRALETGPIALVSPLTSTSSVFTLFLSVFILHQYLSAGQIGAVIIIILGILLASSNPKEIRMLLQTPGYTFFSKGVRWAIIATLAFGAMDFGIGASATFSGWFLPVLWTRIFSICFLTLISYWKRHQRMKRLQLASLAQPLTEEAEHAEMVTQITPDMSSTSHFGNLDEPTVTDPDASVIARSLYRRYTLASSDPEATLISRPSRRLNTIASTVKRTPTLELLETSIEDTIAIRPFRSYSAILTLDEDASPQRRMELNHLDTMFLPEDMAPLSPLQAQEASATSPAERTLSLSLPSLEELFQLRTPLTSVLGLGVLLAILAGVAENAAVLGFSLDTLIATTGIASAITSSYSLIVILFGIIVYSERLTRNQVVGISVFMAGLVLLAIIK